MNHVPNRMLPPGASRKRKDRDIFYKPSVPPAASAPAPKHKTGGELLSSNRLLASYMAHEFLTRGTLFGQKFDPARAEAVPVRWTAAEEAEKRAKKKGAEAESAATGRDQESYAEVASILKTDGAHIPGIVNPTQLARWIKM